MGWNGFHHLFVEIKHKKFPGSSFKTSVKFSVFRYTSPPPCVHSFWRHKDANIIKKHPQRSFFKSEHSVFLPVWCRYFLYTVTCSCWITNVSWITPNAKFIAGTASITTSNKAKITKSKNIANFIFNWKNFNNESFKL